MKTYKGVEVIKEIFNYLYIKRWDVSFSHGYMDVLKNKKYKEYECYFDEQKFEGKKIVSIEIKL